jgi:AcrR family transcriptional regulator
MASAFTEQEKTAIRSALKEAAQQCAATIGMRKTTVDQLAESAGISKGAFYKFYETKEHLFFEVLEEWHTEVYDAAWKMWESRPELPDPLRAAETIMEASRVMEQKAMMDFFENDLPYLLRKIPAEDLKRHYHSDDVHIRELVQKMGISLKQSPEIVSATLRGLILTISHRKQIGEAYPQVLRLLVVGACEQLVLTN